MVDINDEVKRREAARNVIKASHIPNVNLLLFAVKVVIANTFVMGFSTLAFNKKIQIHCIYLKIICCSNSY